MLGFSLVSVYSFVPVLVKTAGGTPFKYLFKHVIYVVISFIAMFWIHKKDPKYLSVFSKLSFYLGIALLIFTFFFGTKVNSAGRWIQIPFVGLTFQSSDFAKLALMVYLAKMLAKKEKVLDSWKEGFIPVMIPIIIICALIVKDNFSTAAIVFMDALLLLFIGRIPFSKIAVLVGGGVLLLSTLVVVHKALPELDLLPRLETWENRILNRYDDNSDVLANAQAENAKLGINNGGLFGQGVGQGLVKEYIPEAYADFYYASFVEEFGSLVSIVLVLFYLILFYRIIRIGLKTEKLFETYLCIGIGILMLSQACINMMVCTGIFPVTGQNMPLLAMGGSALIMTCFSIGIIQSIAAKQNRLTAANSESNGN